MTKDERLRPKAVAITFVLGRSSFVGDVQGVFERCLFYTLIQATSWPPLRSSWGSVKVQAGAAIGQRG